MRLTTSLLVAAVVAAPGAGFAESAEELRARGDALRRAGDYAGALRAFQAAQSAGDRSVETWKRIGWTQRALGRPGSAAAALESAVAAVPPDREALDDLAALRRTRGLRLNAWMGGDEPGSSKQAFNAELWYGGVDRLELKAGYGHGDAIFYTSQKAFASAYWFYSPASYLMADFTFRKYTYPSQLNGAPPNPDSSAYEQAPRGTLELQHWLDPRWRVTATYQLYAPNFAHDTSTRIVNHKLTGELLWAAPGGFRLGALAGGLRDPDPKKTRIKDRDIPGLGPVGSDGNCDPVASPTTCAATTSVKYRVEPLVGGFVGYGAERWSLEVKGLTNRDLDQSYSFSVITTATAQPWDPAELTLAWVHDAYSSVSAYSGKTGEIVWGSGRYWVVPSLAVGGGAKWVVNPSPQSRTSTGTRNSVTLLVNMEYRTGLL